MSKGRILIVEDEVAIATMYQFKLDLSGYDVKCAFNGSDGLQFAEEFLPDLILLDLRMPIMSGEEMLEKMRAQHWGNQIRIIILTNISRDEAPATLRFLNVDRYIVKAHHTPSQVLKVIDSILQTENQPQ